MCVLVYHLKGKRETIAQYCTNTELEAGSLREALPSNILYVT
jgi:hypothetical protein